jgi:hypothetical protein
LVYADDVNIMERSLHTINENTEAVTVASKETGLELIVAKTTYKFRSRYQNTGRSHNRRIDNITFGKMEHFK